MYGLYYDDAVADSINAIYSYYLGRLNIFGYVTIVTSLGSSIGATLFRLWPSFVHMLALIALLFGSVFILTDMFEELEAVYATTPEIELSSPAAILVAIGFIITALVYPHVAYMLEVHRGILTKETYEREERRLCKSQRSAMH